MDPAIAKGAAAALNTFSSDGTFLDSFRNQSGAAAAAAAAPADSPSSEPGIAPSFLVCTHHGEGGVSG